MSFVRIQDAQFRRGDHAVRAFRERLIWTPYRTR
jgi:hypothetical protein